MTTKDLFNHNSNNTSNLDDLTTKLDLDDVFFEYTEQKVQKAYDSFNKKQTKELSALKSHSFRNSATKEMKTTVFNKKASEKTQLFEPSFNIAHEKQTINSDKNIFFDTTHETPYINKVSNSSSNNRKYEEYIQNVNRSDQYPNPHNPFKIDQNISKQREQNEYIQFDDQLNYHNNLQKINKTKIVGDDKSKIFFNEGESTTFVDLNSLDSSTKYSQKEIRSKIKNENKKMMKSLPSFYLGEIRYTQICLMISLLIMIVSLSTFIVVAVNVFTLNKSEWLFLPQSIFNAVSFFFFGINMFKLIMFKRELNLNNNIVPFDIPTANIKRIYKSLCGSSILINWCSLSLYVMSLWGIFLTYMVTYFINLINYHINDFTNLLIGGFNNGPLIIVWTFASLCFLTIALQIFYNLYNIKRRNNIELFYNSNIIDEEMKEKYRKSTNRKGIAIFLSSLLLIGFIILITYLIFKRKTKKTVIVK